MLNDAFLAEQAEHFAQAAWSGYPRRRPNGRSSWPSGWRSSVVPAAAETATCRDLLRPRENGSSANGAWPATSAAHQALAQLCQTLFNTSEFLFAE